MLVRWTCVVLVLGLFLGFTSPANAQTDPQQMVEDYLQNLGARGYTITPITEDYVRNTFPDVAFFGVRFRQFPVAIAPPEGLSSSNVFFVRGEDVFVMTNSTQLHDFFISELLPVSKESQGVDSAKTYMRLTQEFVQDGFYSFSDPFIFYYRFEGGAFAFGHVSVTAGGRGDILALLFFDGNGFVVEVIEVVEVVEGPRPICQATKLLDPDPIVRGMAEQSLLYMGRSAKEYLDEQRAKASPELKEAIDRIWKRIEAQPRRKK